MNKKYTIIKSLTSLRFFAAFGMFLHHLGFLSASNLILVQKISKYFFSGYAGVTFFYILSGFIINFSFERHKQKEKFDYKDFMLFRISRLFPVHLLSLGIFFLSSGLYLNITEINISSFISNLFLLHAFSSNPEYYFGFNSVSWSISCELFFYISFCFLSKLKNKQLYTVVIAITLVIIYFINNPSTNISPHWQFYINPLFRLLDFMIGMLWCRVYLSTSLSFNMFMGTTMELVSIILVGLTIYISTNFISNMNIRYDIIFIPSMTLIVIAFSYNSGLLSNFLSNKYLVLLGESSFSFYMIHGLIISKAIEWINPSLDGYTPILIFSITLLILLITLSVLIQKLFESPINKSIRKAWIKFRYEYSYTYRTTILKK